MTLFLVITPDTLHKLKTLPDELRVLVCCNLGLTSLPTTLPAGLRSLRCSNNRLTSLPTALPAGLETLECDGNPITDMPALPSTVTRFIFEKKHAPLPEDNKQISAPLLVKLNQLVVRPDADDEFPVAVLGAKKAVKRGRRKAAI